MDGDLYLEGATLQAEGTDGYVDGSNADTSPGGGGAVIIVCKGTIFCGAGATINARGKAGGGGNYGGAGGGYVAVVANRIEGTLNIDVGGGAAAGSGIKGNGGYVEVLRSTIDVGDTDPVVNVAAGAGASNSFTKDGSSLLGTIKAGRIPAGGGLM